MSYIFSVSHVMLIIDWVSLLFIRVFLKTSNYVEWYNQKMHEIKGKLQVLHIDSLCSAVCARQLTSFLNSLLFLLGYSLFFFFNIDISCLYFQDVLAWAKSRQEIEIVDMIIRIKDKLVSNQIKSFQVLLFSKIIRILWPRIGSQNYNRSL